MHCISYNEGQQIYERLIFLTLLFATLSSSFTDFNVDLEFYCSLSTTHPIQKVVFDYFIENAQYKY